MGSIKINAQLKQSTILTAQLREALAILEMPIVDLSLWLQTQIEQNPALQYSDEISSHSTPPLLPILQSFDPPGIGARNLRECLLLQLERKNLQNTPAYRLIYDHY